MTDIALPRSFRPESFSMSLSSTQRSFASPFGGSEQVIDLLNDRWMISLHIPQRGCDLQIGIEAYINAMRGMTNTSNLWHMQRPQPRGTMRGTPDCQVTAAGSGQVLVYCTAGDTLLAGDMIGIQGMLLQVREDAVADGSGHLIAKLVNRTRKFIPEGSTVTWDRPTAPFRLISRPFVQFVPGYAQGVDFDFAEAI